MLLQKRLFFGFLLALSSVPLWAAICHVPERQALAAPREAVVNVTGSDFRWNFRLAADSHPRLLEFASESQSPHILRLPAGVTVHWRVTSEDYIYVLRSPQLGISTMAVPGRTTEVTATISEPQEVDLLVDPLCGFRLYHDEWMGKVSFVDAPLAERGEN